MMNNSRTVLLLGVLIFFLGCGEVIGGELSSIIATPINTSSAGEESIYQFTFTTSDTGNGIDTGIPNDGKIVITFNAGFDVSGV